MAKVGDIVRFLNSVGGGRIKSIEGNIARVEDSDGFEVPVLLRELVVVSEGTKYYDSTPDKTAELPQKSKAIVEHTLHDKPKATVEEIPEPVAETPEGEKLNVVLAFEPAELKRIPGTTYDATVVNDSNYYLAFALSTRSAESSQWTLRRSGVIEPSIMLSIGELEADEVNDYENILFQYFAYKEGRPFDAKQPASVELRVDTTRFFKLHAFTESVYFDAPVLELPLVNDDRPYAPARVDARKLQDELRRKKSADSRRERRPVSRRERRQNGPLEIDLHITELVDNQKGLSRADMLNLQIDRFRQVMDENLRNVGQKIVFIHGKGEGVLRQAILKELAHRYKGHDVCDASFREYGFGATQVTIRQTR